ncbi:carboxypeptidase-like regulatory domain-containing protein [Variovorax rhizosphaerae]|uniref:Carboxypeptidase-like regulatory domain-containing protein n=1 Tax=Variovorax rhizosphaerae TaxID=1836200 RepID=A0ABU8WCW1_9BURK
MTTWQSTMRPVAVAVLCGAGLLGALSAQAANPPIHMTNGIEYMSGGIGKDEAQFMETVSPRWAATLEFAVKDATNAQGADFAANVQVRVVDAATGKALLSAQSEGPFLLARLDPGRYDVEATLNGQTLKQELTVRVGEPSKATFVWPTSALRS